MHTQSAEGLGPSMITRRAAPGMAKGCCADKARSGVQEVFLFGVFALKLQG